VKNLGTGEQVEIERSALADDLAGKLADAGMA
jgi:hypothetical protein